MTSCFGSTFRLSTYRHHLKRSVFEALVGTHWIGYCKVQVASLQSVLFHRRHSSLYAAVSSSLSIYCLLFGGVVFAALPSPDRRAFDYPDHWLSGSLRMHRTDCISIVAGSVDRVYLCLTLWCDLCPPIDTAFSRWTSNLTQLPESHGNYFAKRRWLSLLTASAKSHYLPRRRSQI